MVDYNQNLLVEKWFEDFRNRRIIAGNEKGAPLHVKYALQHFCKRPDFFFEVLHVVPYGYNLVNVPQSSRGGRIDFAGIPITETLDDFILGIGKVQWNQTRHHLIVLLCCDGFIRSLRIPMLR